VPRKRWFLERLVHYFHLVNDRCGRDGSDYLSSRELAASLQTDEAQVRRDLASIGVRGAPRKGFRHCEVLDAIQGVLGLDQHLPAILVGAGHLGTAIANYSEFERYGMHLEAVFDNSLSKQGQTVGKHEVLPLGRLEAETRRLKAKLAIITVPEPAAQQVTDMAVAAGVLAIWNFAPTSLKVPKEVFVRNERISAGLGVIAYRLSQRDKQSTNDED
jgi:redox-sensing transcriptional repressor